MFHSKGHEQVPSMDAGGDAGFGVDKLWAQGGSSFGQSCPGGVAEDGQNAAFPEAVKTDKPQFHRRRKAQFALLGQVKPLPQRMLQHTKD